MELQTLTEEQIRKLSSRILEAHYLSMQYDAEAKKELLKTGFIRQWLFQVRQIAVTDKGKVMIEYINYGQLKVEEI